jgi:hypothetical protein
VPIKVLHGENIVYDQTEPEKYSEMVIGDDKDEIRI